MPRGLKRASREHRELPNNSLPSPKRPLRGLQEERKRKNSPFFRSLLSPAHAALKGGSTTAGPPASAKKPLNQVQVITLLAAQVPSHRISMLVQERGVDFEPTDDYLQEVRLAGAEDEVF